MKRHSVGLLRGTSVDVTTDNGMIFRNYRKGVSIDIKLEAQDVKRLFEFLKEHLAAPSGDKESQP